MGKWENWKQRNVRAQEQGRVTPLAALNPDSPRVDDTQWVERLAVCTGCPEFLATQQCRKCGCFMPVKARLTHASCPLGKW